MNKPLPPEVADLISRRRWLLQLGETVALVGFSGVVPPAVAGSLAPTQEPEANTVLPPGLYLPSVDHLAHALELSKESSVTRPGSETEYAQLTTGPYQPQFFSQPEFQIVTRLVRIILGEVDPNALSQAAQWVDFWLYSAAGILQAARHLDPLHRSLAVAYYREAVVKDLETSDPQVIARQGMSALNELSMRRYGNGFLEISESSQAKLIDFIKAAETTDPLRKFFELIGRETILGYYTSAQGIKELNYKGNTYHGQCPGCTQNPNTV